MNLDLVCGFERESIREIDSLQDGRDLVLSVRARRADDEGEVDLRVRSGGLHASASVSATNSCGARASARVSGARSISASASAARCPRREPGEIEGVRQRLPAVRERGLDDPLDVRIRLRQSGAPKRDESGVDIRLRAEDGPRDGMEAGPLGGELDEHRDGAVGLRARARRRTGRRPRAAPSPSTARRLGSPSRLSTTIGVATLYGRLATSFPGAGSSAARSRRSASPK